MKKLLLSMALLLCVGSMLGQTADKLMKKYKGMKSVQYENITKKIMDIKEEEAPDMYRASRGLTKVEYLSGVLSSDKVEQLQKELNALKGFERVYHEKHNGNNGPLSMLTGNFKLFHLYCLTYPDSVQQYPILCSGGWRVLQGTDCQNRRGCQCGQPRDTDSHERLHQARRCAFNDSDGRKS